MVFYVVSSYWISLLDFCHYNCFINWALLLEDRVFNTGGHRWAHMRVTRLRELTVQDPPGRGPADAGRVERGNPCSYCLIGEPWWEIMFHKKHTSQFVWINPADRRQPGLFFSHQKASNIDFHVSAHELRPGMLPWESLLSLQATRDLQGCSQLVIKFT